MIKPIYVCECDICGAIENAKAVTWRNETEYELPDNWVRGNNKKVCICPTCSKKLSASVTSSDTTRDPVPVYGCPSVITIRSESDEFFDRVWEDCAKHGPVIVEDYDNH